MLPLVDQFYYVAAAVGFVFIVGTFVMGQFGDSGGDASGGDGGDFGSADSGGDFGSADSGGDFGSADGGGDFGSADGGDFSSVGSGQGGSHGNAGGRLAVPGTGAARPGTRLALNTNAAVAGPMLFFLKILSPSTIATFLFCFGAAGVLISRALPFLGPLSLLPAVVAGILGYKAISALLGLMVSRMHASTNFRDDQMIGRMAEVTVPIGKGKVGEITFVAGSSRQTSSARGIKPEESFKTSQKVIISDLQDGVFLVEPWTYDTDEVAR